MSDKSIDVSINKVNIELRATCDNLV